MDCGEHAKCNAETEKCEVEIQVKPDNQVYPGVGQPCDPNTFVEYCDTTYDNKYRAVKCYSWEPDKPPTIKDFKCDGACIISIYPSTLRNNAMCSDVLAGCNMRMEQKGTECLKDKTYFARPYMCLYADNGAMYKIPDMVNMSECKKDKTCTKCTKYSSPYNY